MGWFKKKEYFCRHPTCNKRFHTKEEMLKHYYPTHEGCSYDPLQERLDRYDNKQVDEKKYEKDYDIYKKRLTTGESDNSARSGLNHLKKKRFK